MFSALNLLFLSSLGVTSWGILCCLNRSKYEYYSSKFDNKMDFGSRRSVHDLISYLFTLDSVLKLSILCPILLVVSVMYALITATKDNVQTRKDLEIRALKSQNSQLLNFVNKYKDENMILLERIKSDANLIAHLKKSRVYFDSHGNKLESRSEIHKTSDYGTRRLSLKPYIGSVSIVTTQELEHLKGII